MAEIRAASTVVLRFEFPVSATPERLWEALVKETHLWWDQDFVSLKGAECVKLEPWLGGRLYEETADGRSLTWANVIAVREGSSIDLVGYMTPEWTGPTMTMVNLTVAPAEGGSMLKLTEGLLGNISDETVQSMDEGWTFLFGTKLKGYLEANRSEGSQPDRDPAAL